MDGSAGFEAALAYVSRLTGEDVTLDQKLGLRSIQRVAFASWARQANVALRGSLINSDGSFSVRELLANADAEPAMGEGQPPPAASIAAATPLAAAVQGIGIDIEDVESLPEAADFRDHPFYRDNFTPAEISYCVRQADAPAAFCGTWAAKEAIIKASAGGSSLARLIDIEILRDPSGRPIHPGYALSISHTRQTAVATCLKMSTPAAPPPAEPLISGKSQPLAPPANTTGAMRFKALAALSAVIAAALLIYWLLGAGGMRLD